MPDFKEQRDQLLNARAQKEQARLDLFSAREQVRKIEGELAQFNRVFDPLNQGHILRRQQLDKSLADARTTASNRQTAYDSSQQAERDAFTAFAPFTDPRDQVSQLGDEYPFLLLPVRIETRFKTVIVPAGRLHQLWVRVFPSDCAIDSFEPNLSKAEIKSANTYWAEMYRAGKGEANEAQQRGAWRGLVASHGSGRAAWIEKHQDYQPRDLPPPKGEKEIVLVISTTEPLAETELTPATEFWAAIWHSDGNKSEDKAARDALAGAVGPTRASVIIEQYRPLNLEDPPPPQHTKSEITVKVAFLVLPKPETLDIKKHSWTQAPKVNVLPDRFIFIGSLAGEADKIEMGNAVPSPLVIGLDPSADSDDQLKHHEGDLIVGEDMKWMVDFEEAVKIGMGFRINLNNEQARRGFDRLLVLGLRLSADEKQGQTLVETLLEHHRDSRAGFSLLPTGTPTNNTERAGAGFTRTDDADESFDLLKSGPQFTETNDWSLKSDGQWLADTLGIKTDLLKETLHGNGKDQCEARAMNAALWPATLGYWMDTMMHPVFEREATEATRWFFKHFVSGRGMIPAVRIGSQPYGILPTTAFSRKSWAESPDSLRVGGLSHPENFDQFISKLHSILKLMDDDWAEMAKNVSFVGKQGEPHKLLLDILGLHPTSVEYYQAYAESLPHLYNYVNLAALGSALNTVLTAGVTVSGGMTTAGYLDKGSLLLHNLGYEGQERPDVMEKFFFTAQNPLADGLAIDDRPLSETEAIRAYTPEPGGKNYIKWLLDAALSSLETIRLEQGFTDNKPPIALLYILLRHALLQTYWDSSVRLHLSANLMTPDDAKAAQREPNFIHVKDQTTGSESRFQHLYKIEPAITGNNTGTVADFIPGIIGQRPETGYLQEQINALDHLKDSPTARLERAFAEHIDCCSYRWDAWQLGLVNYQLAAMRYRRDHGQIKVKRGVYLGAYGWLEDVRPENKTLKPVSLEVGLDKIFNKADTPPLMHDDSNQGYIHAPSLNQAVTAAVLRNGYFSNATKDNPKTFAVNLSSERVRAALGVIEGIRNGQSLGALLGYQLERGLHDRQELAETDKFILPLREAFPLRANRINLTNAAGRAPIQAVEARNVIDGLALVNHVNQARQSDDPAKKVYPWGKPLLRGKEPQEKKINDEVDRLLDINDALADLAIAEGVHHAAQGNYDRTAATLDTYGKAAFPPEPDVVRTPRSGISFTHRVGLQLTPRLDPTSSPVTGIPATPRSKAEPALNKWLASVLPPPDKVACKVVVAGASSSLAITQENLQLQPIDLLFMAQTEGQQAMAELDDRVLRYIHQQSSPPRPDAEIKIVYTERPKDKTSFFELTPLLRSLRALALHSRPLRSTDLTLQIEAKQAQEETVSINKRRITLLTTGETTPEHDKSLQKVGEDLGIFLTKLKTQITDRAGTIANIDSLVTEAVDLLERASRFGIPQTGWGFAFDWKRVAFSDSLEKVGDLVLRWDDKLKEFNRLMTEYGTTPPPTDPEKFDLLSRAERLISTIPTSLLPPPDPAMFRSKLEGKKIAFAAKRETLDNLSKTILKPLSALLIKIKARINAPPPISDFDAVEFKLDDIEDRIVLFVSDLISMVGSLIAIISDKLSAAQEQLEAHEKTSRNTEQVAALQKAAKILLGEDFQMIPEFMLSPKQAEELGKAAGIKGELLKYQTETLKRDFPVDNWLYGLARVREKMRHWEQTVLLSSAFGKIEPELEPIQLPFIADDRWLGLEFPPEYLQFPPKEQVNQERLIYTAHYDKPFAKDDPQCGLLLDEWSETIPAPEETTGITFHYDRPNCESPQSWLLVTPSDFTGSWQWEDLVGALNETLELAKKRAVEPVHLDATPYARFLPATVMAVSLYPISIAANLALNNKVIEFIGKE